jgi:hypothetical protein
VAKLSAHGKELFREVGLTSSKAWMEDGTTLKNYGQGWKIFGKVKAGVSPQQAADNARERAATLSQRRPAFAAYKKLLHELVCVPDRFTVVAALEVMASDPDGVWSTLDDEHSTRGSYSIDDVVELCNAYEAAFEEQKQQRSLAAV